MNSDRTTVDRGVNYINSKGRHVALTRMSTILAEDTLANMCYTMEHVLKSIFSRDT